MYAVMAVLFAALFAQPQQAQAQDLAFGGVKVTTENCNDLVAAFKERYKTLFGSANCKASGTASYDFSTKTLTLKDLDITLLINPGSIDGVLVNSSLDELNVNLEGDNIIHSATAAFNQTVNTDTHLDPKINFRGIGTLTVKNKGSRVNKYAAINIDADGKMSVMCKALTVISTYGVGIGAAFKYADDGRSTLSLSNGAVLKVQGKGGSIAKLNNLQIGSDYKFHAPKNASWNAEKRAVCDSKGNVVNITVTCAPQSWNPHQGIVTKYDLWIAGTQVTSENSKDLSGIEGVQGKVRYIKSTKTLILQNAKIDHASKSAISSDIDGLVIKVVGPCLLDANRTCRFGKSTTITGRGVLNVRSFGLYAIAMENANLTIDSCTVNISAKEWGIAGDSRENDKLTLKKAALIIEDAEKGAIDGLTALNLEDCKIVQPANAVFSKEEGGVVVDGMLVKGNLAIRHGMPYDLSIAGIQVDSENCKDLTVINGVSGSVRYYPATKTLMLHNATINFEGNENIIDSKIDSLTIQVIGTCKLIAKNTAIYAEKPLTIFGRGNLNIESNGNQAIYVVETDLTIDNCNLKIKTKELGILGDTSEKENLVIKHSSVTIEETTKAAIHSFASVKLEGCSFTQPKEAKFDPLLNGVALNGELVKSKLVITRIATGIDTPTAKEVEPTQGIYTLQGVRLSGELKDLPKGIYIVNGKKVIKQ